MPGKKDSLKELPKLDEWKAPWEVDSDGKDIPEDEQEIDTGRLKKYLHGLQSDKLKLQGQVEEITARAEELEDKVAKAADPAELTKLQSEVTKAQQERDEARQKAEKDGASNVEVLKLRIALKKGLTETQAKRLLGTTEEELEQDAEELLASFGAAGEPKGDEGGDVVRRGPQRVIRSAGDPDPDAEKEKKEIDPDEWAKQYAVRQGRGGY